MGKLKIISICVLCIVTIISLWGVAGYFVFKNRVSKKKTGVLMRGMKYSNFLQIAIWR